MKQSGIAEWYLFIQPFAWDPNAAITLWEKMASAGGSAPPEFMSTHPSSATRTAALRANIPKVMPLYEQARGGR